MCSPDSRAYFQGNVVAFVNENIQFSAVEQKGVEIFLGNTLRKAFDIQKGVDLGDLPRRHNAFVDSDVVKACTYTIEVTQFNRVKISEFQLAACALRGNAQRHRMADRQADDTYRPLG
ncbi:hypothetical protein D3C87_1714110 [compost metagenome]